MTSNRKLASVLIVLGLIAGSAAAATSAQADDSGTFPDGCSLSPDTPSVSSDSTVAWSGTGVCSSGIAQEMQARLVHNYDGLPDAQVASVSDFEGPDWSAGSSTCDNGGTTQYYTELAFFYRDQSEDTQRTSDTVTLTHC